jgi:thiol:disulfide interchange protein
MTRKVFSMFIVVLVGGLIVAGFIFGGNHKTTSLQKTTIASINKPIIPAVFTNLKGQSIALTSYHSKKLMLYLLATWCSSCQASLKTLISNASTLQKDGLNIVTLETYQDAGYSGPSMQQFIATTTDKPLPTNFYFGQASQSLTSSYNPDNAPDIYYLINTNGVIKTINSTPSATINTILQFARSA